MRKSSTALVFGILFLFAFVSSPTLKCFAESNVLSALGGKKSPSKSNSKKDDAAREALRKMILEKKGELNGSSWSIKIESQAKKGDLLGEDTLVFQNDKFRSERADKLGYAPTNYTLTVQESGPTIWETMQTSKKGEVCFWRGEWKENVMTGIISRQLEKGAEEYYFTSASRKDIPKTTDEKEEAQLNPSEQTAKGTNMGVLGSPVAPTQKKTSAPKKKSWFA